MNIHPIPIGDCDCFIGLLLFLAPIFQFCLHQDSWLWLDFFALVERMGGNFAESLDCQLLVQ